MRPRTKGSADLIDWRGPAVDSRPVVYLGMPTPWGPATSVDTITSDIGFVSTASHGGYRLTVRANAAVPGYMRKPDGWYEEDCDGAIVACAYPGICQTDKQRESALLTLRACFPTAYERFTGKKANLPLTHKTICDESARQGQATRAGGSS